MTRRAGLYEPPSEKHKRGRWINGGVLVVGFVKSPGNVLQAVIVRQHQQVTGTRDGAYELVDAHLLMDRDDGESWDPLTQVRERYEKKAGSGLTNARRTA